VSSDATLTHGGKRLATYQHRTLITDARVVSCSGDVTEHPFDGDLLIEGEHIAQVFRGRAPIDRGSVQEIDIAGATVMPGLCDAHVHISWPLDFVFDHPGVVAMPDDAHALEVAGVVRTFLASGYTLLVGAGTLKPRIDVIIQRAIDRGLIPGPRLWPSGEHITQRGGIGAGSAVEADGAEEVRRLVGEQCELGVRSIKLMISGDGIVPGHPSQTTYMDDAMVAAAVREAEANGAFITVHARSTEGVRMAVRNGVRIIHHATYLNDAAISELSAARDDVWVCPGLHYLRAMVEGDAQPYGVSPESVERALYPQELQAAVDGLRKLHSNGVRIVAGGDFGHQWTRHGTYAAELASYVDLLGFSPLESLLTATSNAGPLVGEQLGQIREGYLADLVVVDGDPTVDIRVLLDPDRVGPVIKGGQPALVGWGEVERWARSRPAASV